jgi:hypothetical protein
VSSRGGKEESLSVSIILRQPASFEYILERLKQLPLRDPEWRRPLYRSAFGNDRLGARIAALLQDLTMPAEQSIQTVSLTNCCRSMSG